MLQNIQEENRVQFLSDALSCIGDGVIMADRNGNVIYINTAGEKITGWKNEEAVGKPFDEVFPLTDYFSNERLESPLKNALIGRTSMGLPNYSVLNTKSGKMPFVSASCSPIYGSASDKAEGIVVVFRDIDRIKKIEEEIKKEKNNLNNLLEALPVGVVLLGSDTSALWCNKPFLEMFQITDREKMIGQRFGDAIHCVFNDRGCGESEQCHFCEIRKNILEVIREGVSRKEIVLEREFLSYTEKIGLWVDINFIPITHTDEVQIVVAIEDITERKNYEMVLLKSKEEAELVNRLKSEFIANMSHEIRTPLNGLIGLMDLLSQMSMNAEQLEYVNMAKMSGRALLRVINDILDLSSIEAGTLSVTSVPFDLQSLMEETVKIHQTLAGKKGLKFHYHTAFDLPRYVTGDPDRLRQIINNLIGNAIKFTDIGAITISVRDVSIAEEENMLEFSISDTGIGISPQKMDLLFLRFSQVDGSATRKYGGTGLGLAICKNLAELMGGTIRAKSELGKGSTFLCLIPLKPVEESMLAGSAQDAQQHILSPIIMGNEEQENGAAAEERNQTVSLILQEGQEGSGQFEGVQIGRDILSLLTKEAEPVTEEERSAGIEELRRLCEQLQTTVAEEWYEQLEDILHLVRNAARRIGESDLADLAFKAELLSRKQKWDDTAQCCAKIINQINVR